MDLFWAWRRHQPTFLDSFLSRAVSHDTVHDMVHLCWRCSLHSWIHALICFFSLHSLAQLLNSSSRGLYSQDYSKLLHRKTVFLCFWVWSQLFIVVSLITWAGEVFLNALQISPRLFVPCYVAFPENMRVIEVMPTYQGLWKWSYFQFFFMKGLYQIPRLVALCLLTLNGVPLPSSWVVPRMVCSSYTSMPFTLTRSVINTLLHSMCFLKWFHPFLAVP